MTIDTSTKRRGRTHLSRQTVQIDYDSYEAVAAEATNNRTTAAVVADKITFWCDVPFHLNAGISTVEATTNHPLFPANQVFTVDWNSGDYLAAIRSGSTDGTVRIIGVF